MADINQTAAWVTARLTELGNATNDGLNTLVTDANIGNYSAGNVSGIVPVANGGTGANNAVDGLENLGGIAASDVSTVGKTGDYDDLLNKPTIPVIDQTYNGSTPNGMSGAAMEPYVSELTNVREGADGTTYASAGEAVRTQVTDLTTGLSKAFSTEQTAATSIPSSSDMDDYKTPGNYKVTTTAIAKTIANIPSQLSGRLFVFRTSDATKYWQIYCSNTAARTRVFLRHNLSGTWVDWYEITLPITTVPTEGSGGLITSGAVYTAIAGLADTISATEAELEEMIEKAFMTDEESGAIASFADGADDIPMKSVVAQINPVQAGSGDPSPSNVRAISGWDTVAVNRSRKNLLAPTAVEIGAYNSSGAKAETGTLKYRRFEIMLAPGTYTFSTTLTNAYIIRMFIGSARYDVNTETDTYTFTVASAAVVKFSFRNASSSDITETFNSQIEIGSTATTYEPYQGNTYTIALGQTVYGGTLDVTNGELTVTHSIFDMGAATWTYTSGKFRTASPQDSAAKAAGGIDAICSCFKRGRNSVTDNNTFFVNDMGYSSTKYIVCYDSRYSDAADFKTAMEGQTIVYALDASQTVQLTPTQVLSLLGQNALWSDSGDTEVVYRADPTLYIDKRLKATKSIIAGVEVTNTASQNYTTGQYLIMGDNLYKVTANIASGSTITVGTNVVQTTVAEQLLALA